MDIFVSNDTTTIPPQPEPILEEDIKFLIIPLVVIIVVIILSALVYLMVKRKQEEIIHRNIMKLYEFDSNEQEWETPLLSSQESAHTTVYKTTML
ncbi:uncharacterized protein LOC108742868 [Agrilus planipennis]|uniref:Uncharacterized protein LOC108742868 n=1 Tax=Agrilus planipennis TaxID=224129 RepID=A0A1W4XMV0_AGRPL|nr:uncharacterized protein LOC108742868 [Agrilus planipennis]